MTKGTGSAHLARARRFHRSAKLMYEMGDFGSVASISYLSMLHCANAFLSRKGIRPSTHGGLHMMFREHLVKTGEVDVAFARALEEGYRLGSRGELDLANPVGKEEAAMAIETAERFIAITMEKTSLD